MLRARHDGSVRRRMVHLLVQLLLAAAPVVALAAEALSARQIEEIQRISAAALAKDDLPGLAIAVAKGDQVWSTGFGHADLEQDVAIDARSMFRTASISKWLTATAVLRLVEQGKLDLDVPVQQYCSAWPGKQATVTARLLLSHLSGIRHYHGANGEPRATEAQRQALQALMSREESTQYTRYTDVVKPLDAFKDDALMFEPGTRQLYSSLGYRLLGCVAEGAAKMPYRTLMRELVFVTAGMTSIREDDALTIVPHRVQGYARNSDGTLERARFRDVSDNLPGGGHLSTAQDLVRFAAAFNAGRLVRPETRDRMIARPKLRDGSETPFMPPFFGMGASTYYGMGMFVSSTNGELYVMHSGSQSGTSTELLLAPQQRIAVAVMVNMNGWTGAHALATSIVQIARQKPAER